MTTTTAPAFQDTPLVIGGRTFRSRLLVGTGKYKDNATMVRALEAAGADGVTVAVRRISLDEALIAHAGIKRDAVLVGSLTKFNIYAPARWGKVEDRTSGENFGDLMRRLGI